MLKLKKFQAVLMENGAMRVGLKELLLKPGQVGWGVGEHGDGRAEVGCRNWPLGWKMGF